MSGTTPTSQRIRLGVFTSRRKPSSYPQEIAFRVGMTCEGCSNAVKRILGKIEGVESVVTDVAGKSVKVQGTSEPAVMLAALEKWAAASKKEVALL